MKCFLKTIFIAITFIALCLGYLLYDGYICLNSPESDKFPIAGVDVSAYQGNIEWDKVKDDGFKFVYIKATEGKLFLVGLFLVALPEGTDF